MTNLQSFLRQSHDGWTQEQVLQSQTATYGSTTGSLVWLLLLLTSTHYFATHLVSGWMSGCISMINEIESGNQ
jgi:hypothetical protein